MEELSKGFGMNLLKKMFLTAVIALRVNQFIGQTGSSPTNPVG